MFYISHLLSVLHPLLYFNFLHLFWNDFAEGFSALHSCLFVRDCYCCCLSLASLTSLEVFPLAFQKKSHHQGAAFTSAASNVPAQAPVCSSGNARALRTEQWWGSAWGAPLGVCGHQLGDSSRTGTKQLNKLRRGGVGNVLQEPSLAQEWNSAPGALHHVGIPCFISCSSSIHRKNILGRYATTVSKEGCWAWDKEQHAPLVQGTGKCWMYTLQTLADLGPLSLGQQRPVGVCCRMVCPNPLNVLRQCQSRECCRASCTHQTQCWSHFCHLVQEAGWLPVPFWAAWPLCWCWDVQLAFKYGAAARMWYSTP